jgi:HEAT repeat protein
MMVEHTAELKKLGAVATDMQLSSELRIKAVKLIGELDTHEALLALLDLVANERLTKKEREFALKQAGEIIKKIKA